MEERMTTYVHYGSDHFIPAAFIPVRNAGWMEDGWRPKPADGTGLWASRVNDEWGWEAWCRGAEFHLDSLNQSVASKEVFEAAEKAGIKATTLIHSKKKANVESHRTNRRNSVWMLKSQQT